MATKKNKTIFDKLMQQLPFTPIYSKEEIRTLGLRPFAKAAIKKTGWKRESARHALARKGVKTAVKKKKWTGGDETKRISKLSNKALLQEFKNQDYLQFEYGQTSKWDSLVYAWLEDEINKRGLEDKAEAIVEANKKRGEKLG